MTNCENCRHYKNDCKYNGKCSNKHIINEVYNQALKDFVEEIKKSYETMQHIPQVEKGTANTIVLLTLEKLKKNIEPPQTIMGNMLEKVAKYCNEVFSGKYTLSELLEWLDVNLENETMFFIQTLIDACNSMNNTLLKDNLDKNIDAYSQIQDIMSALHYDNGQPLINEEYNYFDFYDRQQDFAGFFLDTLIYDFVVIEDELYIRMNMDLEELKETLTNMYDGSSYDHDFN